MVHTDDDDADTDISILRTTTTDWLRPSNILDRNNFHMTNYYCHKKQQNAFILLISLNCLLISISNIKSLEAALSKCNFELQKNGCFSQANFICDLRSYECVCHPETPILIDDRFCVKRSKPFETCQYNQQCDNNNGFSCSPSEYLMTSTQNGNISVHNDNSADCTKLETRCRCYKLKPRPHSNSKHYSHPHQSDVDPKTDAKHSHHSQTSSLLPRLVWIFLIGCFFGLIILLILIKSQHHRFSRPPFPHQEDRVSISSEPDAPPSYEVAIRMKL